MARAVTNAGDERTERLGEWARVWDVFVAPSKTFRDLLRSSRWWLPFLLLALVTAMTTYTIDRKVGFDRVVETQVHANARQAEAMESLTPAARQERMHGMATGYRVVAYASPLLVLAFSAIGALVLMATFNFGLGARATYRQMFAMWMYASLPRLLTGVLTSVTLLAGSDPEGFNLQYPIGTNPAFFLPDAATWVRSALSWVDAIGLWVLVLMVLGSEIVAGVSRGKATAVVVGWWVLGLLVSVGLAAAFS